ncbi:hypothetical protein BKA70DRAFT_1254199 [Coprinopsis sp. MPI-PUGE-AT-0042]|nr:hypothetical protein BKA70DRAFT_1254199 [Coprinopsis sp. MPI-PUGE-AT-0042]
MPNFLKKKRHSSVTVVPTEDNVVLHTASPSSGAEFIPVPSTPPTKLKSHERMSSTDSTLSTPSMRRRLSSLSSSPSHIKTVAKKVKKQIHDLLPSRPGRAHAVGEDSTAVEQRPAAQPKKWGLGKIRDRPAKDRSPSMPGLPIVAPIAIIHAFPSFYSSTSSSQSSTTSAHTRYRTTSTIRDDGDNDYESRYDKRERRLRTISCPDVLSTHTNMATSPAEGLLTVSEEASKPLGPVQPVEEEEVPDPFLIDDEGDALSEDNTESESTQPVSEPLSIEPSPAPLSAKPLPSPFHVDKEVPPPPPVVDESESEEEEVPVLSLPALVLPTMFLPIPNTDPLTTLLNKYIYPPEKRPKRDVSGEWQNADFHTLVMTNSWRSLARMARDRIVAARPENINFILGLWHLRLSCLARLRLFNQTAAECTNLFSVLNAIEPPEAQAYLFSNVLPFELEVMQTRLLYWGADHMGYLDALSALLSKCKSKAREAGRNKDETNASMWTERGSRVVLIIASQMVEMKEYSAAARLLEPLCGTGSPALRSAVARIYLQSGNVPAAAKHFEAVDQDPSADERQKKINSALLSSARGEWDSAVDVLKEMIEQDNEDYAAVNNLSVALLGQGKLKEGIEVLESALKSSPSSVVVAEPFLFNLSTLYELRSMLGFEKKRALLVEVSKWSGDGLKTSCLKLPAN